MLHHFEKKSLTNLDPAINKECTFSTIKIPEIIFESNNLDVPKSNEFTDKTKIMQAKPFMDSEYDSCTSISSNKSCNSKSSDDVFHSCESLSEILDSSSELDESKNSLMQSNQSLCEVNSSVDLNSSITENVDYPNEAKIAISNVSIKSQQQYVTLSFPVNLVPKKVLKNIKLHAMIKVGLIPHVLPHLSHVLYMDTI
ncbi:hypothetical protein CEXT_118771 [Caerostris extrusa]|uniref:Uncharacterized protein n=1 Tax=Caerostris extrusa TaxID=172846 RepID=A0AAV4VRR6_CAEEX|nr:hypothetical protein CEXT_118771 [Caerostris extrusa]